MDEIRNDKLRLSGRAVRALRFVLYDAKGWHHRKLDVKGLRDTEH